MDGGGAVTGHIISTTIGGKNGEPKQVNHLYFLFLGAIDNYNQTHSLAD